MQRLERREAATAGALAGAGAWIVGYAVTYLAAGARVEEVVSGVNIGVDFIGGASLPPWKPIAWLYLNSHFVDARVRGMGGRRPLDLLTAAGGEAELLYLLPPLVLLLAGGAAAGAAGLETPRSGAAAGAATLVGYLPATVAGALLSNHGFGGGITVGVPVGAALLLAGVAYPLVCGTVGGVTVAAVRSLLT